MMRQYKTAAEDFPSPEQFRIGLNSARQTLGVKGANLGCHDEQDCPNVQYGP